MVRRAYRHFATVHGVRQIAWAALLLNMLIVVTGAAVRLTGSGLGCPDWPRCYDNGPVLPRLETADAIEFGNRLITTPVSIASFAALFFAWRLRPRRKDLVVPAALLALGVVVQAVLGGITVLLHLRYEIVALHYLVSMLLILAAVVLLWRAYRGPDEARRRGDPDAVRWTRVLFVYGFIVVAAGTIATAAGPHAGGAGTGDVVSRLSLPWFEGGQTTDWVIRRHGDMAAILGVGAVALFFFLRRRGAEAALQRAVAWTAVLIALQGVVGLVQYYNGLPAEIVWVHVLLATLTWGALSLAVAAAGRAVRVRARTRVPVAEQASAHGRVRV